LTDLPHSEWAKAFSILTSTILPIKDWPESAVYQAWAEAACLLRKRMSEDINTPVFAVLTNAEFFRFFAIDVDMTVYCSHKRYFNVFESDLKTSINLSEILTWLVWILKAIQSVSRRSPEQP